MFRQRLLVVELSRWRADAEGGSVALSGSRDQLMARVWGYAAALDTGTLTVHVRRLREKLEDDPSKPDLLETVWGVGYRLRA